MRTQVFVRGTLYKRHEAVARYDPAALRQTVTAIRPDALVLDVTPTELSTRKVWPGKIEYPGVIFPFIDAGRYRVYAAEPGEPLFSEIFQSIIDETGAFQKARPDGSEGLKRFAKATYGALYAA